jgi:enoyl-CoA hydratase/carnithine racemase
MTPNIKVELREHVAHIRFDRAQSGGTVDLETMQELCEALDQASANPDVHALTLGAHGRHFCAGADFDFLQSLSAMPAHEVRARIYNVFQGAARRLYGCSKPTLAMIDGAALTVGCELSLVCDFRIATPRARFQQSWIKLGLIPPLAGTFMLPHMVGAARAADMVLRARAVDGHTAVAWGFVNELVAPEELEQRGHAFARELAAAPAVAYGAAKAALARALHSDMNAEWEANALTQSLLFGSDDFQEGLDAARDKRSAQFSRP